MEVTPIGWVCIVAGVVSLLRPRRLAALLAAGATFSATAVVNFPAVPFGLQPYHWFGTLLAMNVGFLQPPPPRVFRRVAYRPVRWLLAFIAWGVVSTISAGTNRQSAIHLAHVLFGVAVAMCIPAVIRDLGDVITVARAAVAGATAAALWGVVQAALFAAGVEYPAYLFNNSVGDSAGGYVGTVASGLIPRVSSVATEPSFLVRSLVPCLIIVVIGSQEKVGSGSGTSRSVLKDWRAWALLSATVLSTSTTGFVGLGLLLLGAISFLPGERWRLLGMSLVLMAVGALATWNSPGLRLGLIEELLANKVELGSGAQRVSSIEEAWNQFLASPLAGTGPGVVTSDDLVVKLLANYGLVGAALFLSAMGSVLVGGLVAARRASARERSVLIALLGANGILWAMDLVAGLSYTYGIFWVLWALLAAATGPFEQQEGSPNLVDVSPMEVERL